MIDHIQALKTDTLLHEFRIIKLLGEGGFGLTYLTFDENLEKQVAIKEYLPTDFAVRTEGNTVIPRTEKSKGDFNWGLNAFLDEARVLARFDHPNIVRINRFFQLNGTAYIVMEYVEGRTLSTTIEDLNQLTEKEVLAILNPLIAGLQEVHNLQVYHRDIKPDNIIIRDNGSPVLIDFGAARQTIGSKSRSITTIITPGFAPIEQYSSKGKLGAWTDIYALAAVAYTCLTGSRPGDASDRVVEDDVPPLAQAAYSQGSPDFLSAIDSALAIFPKDRPQTLDAWLQILHQQNSPLASSLSPEKATPFKERLKQDELDVISNKSNQSSITQTFDTINEVERLRIAACQGFADAQYQLGVWTQHGIANIEKDETAAEQWYRKSAVQGNEKAQTALQKLNNQGKVSTKEESNTPPSGRLLKVSFILLILTISYNLFNSSAPVGPLPQDIIETEDESLLPLNIRPGPLEQVDTPNNFDQAITEKLSKCEAHFNANRLTVGASGNATNCYSEVLKIDPTNYTAIAGLQLIEEKYAHWANKALSTGNINKAKRNIKKLKIVNPGSKYLYDLDEQLKALKLTGNISDGNSRALKLYLRKAERGDINAQNNLGYAYSHGEGVAQNKSKAVKWYRKAAIQGNAIAQSNLAYAYWSGQGVTKNAIEAVKWYRKAARQGNATAQQSLKNLNKTW